MTSHNITIAKASFAAACLRPDTTQLTREDVSRFHNLFETTVLKCAPSNIQKCKEWLLENIVLSTHRITALGKYLVASSKDLKPRNEKTSNGRTNTSINRQRLHILYVLNDLLHHTKHHNANSDSLERIVAGLQGQVPELYELARLDGKKPVRKRLDDLLNLWEHEQYFDKEVFDQLRKGFASNGGRTNSMTDSAATARSEGEIPYIMPATHGDPTLPYYDLPAANLMPHIVPNESIPMRPEQIKALQLSSGPADEGLVNALKDFLKDVKRMDNPYQSFETEGIVADMDELGQLSYHNETDDVMVDTYYGWSKTFCEKMKKRGAREENDFARDRSRSYSRSRERSNSSSRSRSPPKRRRNDSRNQSPLHRHRFQNRSNSQSPDRVSTSFSQTRPSPTLSWGSKQPSLTFNGQYVPNPPFPVGPNNMPIPPRPPNYNGPWPPPPPPPPPSYRHPDMQFPPASQFEPRSNASAHSYPQNNR